MSGFVFSLPQPSLAVAGNTARFPVRRVWCVGRNYLAHVREMNNDERDLPIFFSKQPDMVVPGGGAIRYPSVTQNLHHEVELVVTLKAGGENVPVSSAASLIFGHAIGIDLTRRDLQKLAADKGKPWEIAKSFEQSGPVGTITPSSTPLGAAQIQLSVNGQTRQKSDIDQMIWNVAEIISKLSEQVPLAAGDIIFTGTPDGVGPLAKGDTAVATIAGLESLSITIG